MRESIYFYKQIRILKNEKMKKTIYVASIIAVLFINLASCTSKSGSKEAQDGVVIDAAHNSRNSLDWDGIYTGIIPCADCEGIKVQITLNFDETYQVSYLYLGKSDIPETFSGKFTWDAAGRTITLDTENFPSRYKVGENRLILLDMEGNLITGQHADMYVLTKRVENGEEPE